MTLGCHFLRQGLSVNPAVPILTQLAGYHPLPVLSVPPSRVEVSGMCPQLSFAWVLGILTRVLMLGPSPKPHNSVLRNVPKLLLLAHYPKPLTVYVIVSLFQIV